MGNRRFDMHEYRQIIVRLRQGDSVRRITRDGCAGRKKVREIRQIAQSRGWLNLETALPDDSEISKLLDKKAAKTEVIAAAGAQSKLAPFLGLVNQWCQQGIQATTIHAALIREHGFTGSYDIVVRHIRRLKKALPEVTTILDFKPGEAAQVDFGQGPVLTNSETGEQVKTWFFVMVLAWSRHQYAEIVLRQDVATWLGCHRRALEWFGGVPGRIIIDNPKCAITRACYHDPVVQRAYGEFASGYGFVISACPPRDPKKKGRCESGVKYVKKNFMPLRTFRHLADANQQLHQWIMETAGERIHGTTREKPLILFETERLVLKRLPDRPPECATWVKAKLHGDCHIMLQKCRYSAPWQLAGKSLWVRYTDTTVRIYHEHELVATHVLLTRPGKRSSLPEHLPPNALAFSMQDPVWLREQAAKIGASCAGVIHRLLTDSVVDYLRAAQGIVKLAAKYGNARLEAACLRALAFDSVHYKTIKTMLETGHENDPLPNADVTHLGETWRGGGIYSRDPSTFIVH